MKTLNTKRKPGRGGRRLLVCLFVASAIFAVQACVQGNDDADDGITALVLGALGPGNPAVESVNIARNSMLIGPPSLRDPASVLKPNSGHTITRPTGPITIINPATRDGDKDGLSDLTEHQLMRKFAPVLYLHPNEQSVPHNVRDVLKRAQLKHNSDNWCKDRTVRNAGQLTTRNIGEQRANGLGKKGLRFCATTSTIYHSYKWYPSGKQFYLNIDNRQYGGDLANARCYAHIRKGASVLWRDKNGTRRRNMYIVSYWWFYAYNPPWGGIAAGHEGDFEHIDVIVNPDQTLHSVNYVAHGDDKIVSARSVPLVNGRPKVYSARGGHGSYPTAGRQGRGGLIPPDWTANGGKKLDCLTSTKFGLSRLTNVGNRKYPTPGNEWSKYRGDWGDKKAGIKELNGPGGPKMD